MASAPGGAELAMCRLTYRSRRHHQARRPSSVPDEHTRVPVHGRLSSAQPARQSAGVRNVVSHRILTRAEMPPWHLLLRSAAASRVIPVARPIANPSTPPLHHELAAFAFGDRLALVDR